MIPKQFKRQMPGEVIQARTINEPTQALSRLFKLRVGPGLRLQWVGGVPLISLAQNSVVNARLIAGTAGAYTWQGIYATSGGGWADLGANVSDNGGVEKAYEYNANNSIAAGTRVELRRDPYTREWRFQLSSC